MTTAQSRSVKKAELKAYREELNTLYKKGDSRIRPQDESRANYIAYRINELVEEIQNIRVLGGEE